MAFISMCDLIGRALRPNNFLALSVINPNSELASSRARSTMYLPSNVRTLTFAVATNVYWSKDGSGID